jgi:2-polyprenyl-3-methyl-5-hydroxy-6-metoxy-1,4-benzoquinol methylase
VATNPFRRLRHVFVKVRRDLLSASPIRLFRYARTLLRVMRVSRGEFYVPRRGGEDWRLYGDTQNIAHLLRYEWAESILRERKAASVIDVACGAGHGSRRFAEFATQVVSADASPRAIAYARQHYAHPKIRYERALLEDLPELLGDERFDAVVSFDTIEHAEGEQWLEVFTGLLKPGGTLLLSTPMAKVTTRTPANPHHHIEYSPEDLRLLLETRFESVLGAEALPAAEVFEAASRSYPARRFFAKMSPCVCTRVKPA